MCQQPTIVFKEGGIVVAIYDTLVQNKLDVNVFLLHDAAVFQHFQCPALATKGAEYRQVAEVIQMVVNRGKRLKSR